METSQQLPRCVWALALTLLGAVALPGRTVATLKTGQTSLQFAAGATEPQLLSVAFRDQPVCNNEQPETLIPFVKSGGRTWPVHWRFNRTASRIGSPGISLVYRSDFPRLLLRWEWTAPLATGPIEHTVRILNLETGKSGFPCRIAFASAAAPIGNRVLEHFYVEKGAGEPSAGRNASGRHAARVSMEWDVEHIRAPGGAGNA